MKTQSPDTHPEIERILIEAYRRMTPAEKFRRVEGMNRAMEMLAMADIKRRYPNASEHECRLRAASRRLPAELMRKAFGWDPDKEGY
jgi:hypothetical protein